MPCEMGCERLVCCAGCDGRSVSANEVWQLQEIQAMDGKGGNQPLVQQRIGDVSLLIMGVEVANLSSMQVVVRALVIKGDLPIRVLGISMRLSSDLMGTSCRPLD